MGDFYTSVILDADKCNGCINCLKRCPTEAIRVRNGKAVINRDKCIDCGECINVCPSHAKKSRYTKFEEIEKFKYKIALPDQALYGQFNKLKDVNIILTGLKRIGFDKVFEVSAASELITDTIKSYVKEHSEKWPLISTACPAVVRLISIRFPGLIDNLLPVVHPAEISARIAKEDAAKELGLDPSEVGVFYIAPCPAKVSAQRHPIGIEKSMIDGVIPIKDVYPKLVSEMPKIVAEDAVEDISMSGRQGIRWGATSGGATSVLDEGYIAADGIESVIKVLEELDDNMFSDLKFAELNACNGGCVGGPLNVENPHLARAKLQAIRKGMPELKHEIKVNREVAEELVYWDTGVEYQPVYKLADSIKENIEKRAKVEELISQFPGLDCGGCGAPSCKAWAQDIVQGKTNRAECPLKDTLAKRIKDSNESK